MLKLGTLLKYEFKSVGRVLMPLFGLFLAVSLLCGLANFESIHTGVRVLAVALGVLYTLMACAVVVVTAIVLIQRFNKNLLGNEGYLCFTLPVSVNSHIACKTISAGIWLTIGAITGMLSLALLLMNMVTPMELIIEGQRLLHEMAGFHGTLTGILVIVEIIVLLMLVFGEAAVKIYAAISLGQLWSGHRVAGAIFSFIGFSIVETILGNIVMVDEIDSMLYRGDFFGMQMSFAVVAVSGAVLMAIYWVVSNRLLNRHLNLQ